MNDYKDGFDWLTEEAQRMLIGYEMKEFIFPNGQIERWFTANGESIVLRYSDDRAK